MIERVRGGDLLDARVEALVNPVNTAGVMGKGLALAFRRRFPANFAAYERACRAGEVRIGRMFVFDAGETRDGPRWIVNFPTKEHWRSPSRLEFVESGLAALVREVRERGIATIAVPALGCGLGGLDWSHVSPIVERAFEGLSGVRALVYEPR